MTGEEADAREVPDARDAQLAIARAALRRLSLNDEMVGLGQRDGDPELTARCRHAAGALETMDRLSAPVPAAAAATRAEVLGEIARDWTIDPATGRSNSSPMFRRLAADVARLIEGGSYQLIELHAERTAGLIMAQLAHKRGLMPHDDTAGAELERLRLSCQTLGTVTTALSRTLKAAWIELARGRPAPAQEWIAQAVEDTWDGDEWDGAESAQEWFDRTEPRDG